MGNWRPHTRLGGLHKANQTGHTQSTQHTPQNAVKLLFNSVEGLGGLRREWRCFSHGQQPCRHVLIAWVACSCSKRSHRIAAVPLIEQGVDELCSAPLVAAARLALRHNLPLLEQPLIAVGLVRLGACGSIALQHRLHVAVGVLYEGTVALEEDDSNVAVAQDGELHGTPH
jgi:hypothetical protein